MRRVLAGVKTTVDGHDVSPAQHHDPIEMLSTTAEWSGGKPTIHEGSQSSGSVRAAIARALRLHPAVVAQRADFAQLSRTDAADLCRRRL